MGKRDGWCVVGSVVTDGEERWVVYGDGRR